MIGGGFFFNRDGEEEGRAREEHGRVGEEKGRARKSQGREGENSQMEGADFASQKFAKIRKNSQHTILHKDPFQPHT